MTEGNNSQEEKEDVYLDLISTKSYLDSLLIKYGASYHVTLYKEWFDEYEKFGGGHVLLGDDLLTKIVGWGKV